MIHGPWPMMISMMADHGCKTHFRDINLILSNENEEYNTAHLTL